MTLTIALKVGDGIVLAADSAASLGSDDGVANVYFNAEKVVNLVKGQPIGAAFYGLGGLAGRSITSLCRDLREQLTNREHPSTLPDDYTMEVVASRVHQFFYENLYKAEFPKKFKNAEGKEVEVHQPMGFLIAGFSAGARYSEVWRVEIDARGNSEGPKILFDRTRSGVIEAKGQPEAVYRLIRGWSPMVIEGLVRAGIAKEEAAKFLQSMPVAQLIHEAMPIQDAIELARFLVDTTCQFVRFLPSPPTVAPPIDIAAITPHEGFRWVCRKHYYTAELNSERPSRP